MEFSTENKYFKFNIDGFDFTIIFIIFIIFLLLLAEISAKRINNNSVDTNSVVVEKQIKE